VALSEKDRMKRATKAAKQLPPGTKVRTLVQGSGHFRMTTTSAVLLGVFAVAFVVLLSRGIIIFPGLLLIAVVWGEIRPRRDLVATDQGLAILHRSPWTGSPKKVIVLLPPAPLYAGTTGGTVELELGPERITLKRKEFDRLAAAMGAVASAPVPQAPAGWTPPTGPGTY